MVLLSCNIHSLIYVGVKSMLRLTYKIDMFFFVVDCADYVSPVMHSLTPSVLQMPLYACTDNQGGHVGEPPR